VTDANAAGAATVIASEASRAADSPTPAAFIEMVAA
jgi:hypothetical protein